MLSLKEFKKLHMFSCGYFSSVLPSKGQGCYSGSIIHIKQFDFQSLEGQMQNLSPISFCPVSLFLFAKNLERKQLHYPTRKEEATYCALIS